MKLNRYAIAAAALAAGTLALSACGSTSNTSSAGSTQTASKAATGKPAAKKAGKLNIAFIPGITTDGFFLAMQHAAEKAAPKLNI
jgi:ABC-type sugar transport system substrate-binding protein